MATPPRGMRPLKYELPELLDAHQPKPLSLRALAQQVDVNQSHLSRILREKDYRSVSGDLAGRIAVALGLPEDYFPEYRMAYVLKRIRDSDEIRDTLYDYLHTRT